MGLINAGNDWRLTLRLNPKLLIFNYTTTIKYRVPQKSRRATWNGRADDDRQHFSV